MRKTAAAFALVLVFLGATFTAAGKPTYGAAVAENSWVMKAPMQQARSSLGVAHVLVLFYCLVFLVFRFVRKDREVRVGVEVGRKGKKDYDNKRIQCSPSRVNSLFSSIVSWWGAA